MKKVTKESLMLLLKGVLVIALFSVIVINMYFEPVYAATKDYSTFDFDKLKEDNLENWTEYCKNSYNEQGNAKVEECVESLSDTLESFYKKLYKLLSKYQEKGLDINDQVILWTVFFGQFATPTTGNSPYIVNNNNNKQPFYKNWPTPHFGFNSDNSDGSDEQVEPNYTKEFANYYAQETDTLKVLIRNAVAYTTTCYGKRGDVITTTRDDNSVEKTCEQEDAVIYDSPSGEICADIQTNEMGFWKYFVSKMKHTFNIFGILFLGFEDNDQYYDECMAWKDTGKYSDVGYVYNEDPRVSYEMYFDFLKENAYFDGKSNLQYYFNDVLSYTGTDCLKSQICENSLEAKGDEEYLKYMDYIREDRLKIIRDILRILDDLGIGISYDNYTPSSELIPGNPIEDRKAYYWPIGSDSTEVRDGITYADGDPASTDVISNYGERTNPVTKEKEFHYGIDISGVDGVTNVIAVEKGEVIYTNSDCSSGDSSCNQGYGNMIILGHSDGNYTVYGLLSSIDSSVTVGTTVQRGQLIGKVGKTGHNNAAALHFEIREDGNSTENAVDPLSILKRGTPRPAGFTGGDFSMRKTTLTREEFISGLVSYCNKNSCNSKKLGYFRDQAGLIYDLSKSNGLNPEFTVVRACVEGFSPNNADSSNKNYWGIGCTNKGGLKACTKYSSLEQGIVGLSNLGIVKRYESALEVFTKGHYAYIGDYWEVGGSNSGGCYYFPYIRKYYSNASRVTVVEGGCNRANSGACSGSACLKTNDEDQEAYGYYNISDMADWRYNIWGL